MNIKMFIYILSLFLVYRWSQLVLVSVLILVFFDRPFLNSFWTSSSCSFEVWLKCINMTTNVRIAYESAWRKMALKLNTISIQISKHLKVNTFLSTFCAAYFDHWSLITIKEDQMELHSNAVAKLKFQTLSLPFSRSMAAVFT